MKKKIALIAIYDYPMDDNMEEIGICYIASYLRTKGYDVLLMGAKEKVLDYDRVIKFKPDLIGFPVYNVSKNAVYRACNKLKESLEDVKVVVGGSLPTYYSKELLFENNEVDFVIRGEGELVFYKLLQYLEGTGKIENISGLTYRYEGEVFENEDQEYIENLDDMPAPARDLLRDNNIQFAQILTSRGCTRNCSFCCSKDYWKGWRGRCIKNVVDEIEGIVKEYGVSQFYFIDSSFEDPGMDYNRVKNILSELIERKLEISYYIYMRPDFQRVIDAKLIELFKNSGLCGIMLGVDTANEQDRKLYNKAPTTKDCQKAIDLFHNNNIIVNIGFINFNPYSSFESIRTNVDFLWKNKLAAVIPHIMSTYRLYKGTKLFDKIKKDRLLRVGEYDNFYLYDFVDSRIEKLVVYMDAFLSKLAHELNRIYHFACDYKFELTHYKRVLSLKGDNVAIDIIDKCCMEINSGLAELNDMNKDIIYKLLALAENNWNDETATKILEDSYIYEITINILKKFEKKRIKLNYDLIKMNHEYEKIIV